MGMETKIQADILRHCIRDDRVAWIHRVNSGAALVNNRHIRFGWKGCADLIGQLKDGRFLAIEVKTPSGKASEEQKRFIRLVNMWGGVAGIARRIDDVDLILRGCDGL